MIEGNIQNKHVGAERVRGQPDFHGICLGYKFAKIVGRERRNPDVHVIPDTFRVLDVTVEEHECQHRKHDTHKKHQRKE